MPLHAALLKCMRLSWLEARVEGSEGRGRG